MITFREFILKEDSLRQILKTVPQNPEHHAEGDVFTHARMVRSRLPHLEKWFMEQGGNDSSPLSNIDFRLTESEKKILSMAAWLHDIGKATATKWDGRKKKYSSKGHETRGSYEPQIRRLTGKLKTAYESLSEFESDVLHFIIDHHMSLEHGSGFDRKIARQVLDKHGKVKNEIKPKLLVFFIMMDRTGRLRAKDHKPGMDFEEKQAASLENMLPQIEDTIRDLRISARKL